jgi:hypothetical protein
MNYLFFAMSICFLFCTSFGFYTNANSNVSVFQGWTEEEKERLYKMDGGAQIIPYRWLEALEFPDSTKKIAENLEVFGLVKLSHKKYVGVTAVDDERTRHLYQEKKWMGLNCTSCHTSQFQVNGKMLVIDGNQSLFRLQEFEEALIRSVSETLNDTHKFERFAKKIGDKDGQELKTQLNLFLNEFKAWNIRNHHYFDKHGREVRYGPGRIDGLGGATNELNCHLTDRMGDNQKWSHLFVSSKNCEDSHPPTSYPHLWGIAQEEFAQWDGRIHSALGRNVGAMMAAFSKNWIEKTPLPGVFKVKTTANVENIYEFEESYKKLKAPLWNDLVHKKIVKPLDVSRVSRGEKIYEKNCLECHAVKPEYTVPNKFGNSWYKTHLVSPKIVQTDELHLIRDRDRKAEVHPEMKNLYKLMFGNNVFDQDGKVSARQSRTFLVSLALKTYFVDSLSSPEKIAKFTNCRDSSLIQNGHGIKAEHLSGIIWTAPYLHNGSVSTLFDLLLPANKRPRKFKVGCLNYSIEKFGFDCENDTSSMAFVFDTTQEGNSAQGHEYGVNLSDDEKVDLVEFLKSLESPDLPSPQNADCN